jgi:hypothetical protein
VRLVGEREDPVGVQRGAIWSIVLLAPIAIDRPRSPAGPITAGIQGSRIDTILEGAARGLPKDTINFDVREALRDQEYPAKVRPFVGLIVISLVLAIWVATAQDKTGRRPR